jgi:hypothetical protein
MLIAIDFSEYGLPFACDAISILTHIRFASSFEYVILWKAPFQYTGRPCTFNTSAFTGLGEVGQPKRGEVCNLTNACTRYWIRLSRWVPLVPLIRLVPLVHSLRTFSRKYSRMVSFAGNEAVGGVFVEVKAGE